MNTGARDQCIFASVSACEELKRFDLRLGCNGPLLGNDRVEVGGGVERCGRGVN